MSKELTPLKHLEFIRNYEIDDEHRTLDMNYACKQSLDIIEIAIKRLEEHDKIFKKYDINDIWLEPALYVIKNHFPMNTETQLKKMKSLDIIKKKNINVRGIINSPTLEHYIDHCMPRHSEEPTQEEYNLLKEVLL